MKNCCGNAAIGDTRFAGFLSLPTADMAMARVAARVAQGGHNVPEADIRRRFDLRLKNFHGIYMKVVDGCNLQKLKKKGERHLAFLPC